MRVTINEITNAAIMCVSFCKILVPREGVEPSEPGLEDLVPVPLDERNLFTN